MTLATSPTFAELLRTQSGVITRQQALGAGLASAAVDNQLRSRRWQQLQRGVYACFTGRPARDAELWAAVLRAGIMTVRYNWADVNYRACMVAAQVSELLRMRGTAVRLRRCGPSCSAVPS
jgi:hypothetical protein